MGYPNEKYPAYTFDIDDVYPIYVKIFKDWCEENCKEPFDMSVTDFTDQGLGMDIVFTFISEEDAMAFKLRWV